MHRRVLLLIVVALVGVTTAVVAATAAAATRRHGCGLVSYLSHGAEYWHYEVKRLRTGKIPPRAHWPKKVWSHRGCGVIAYDGHGAEYWHAAFVRHAIQMRKHRARSFGARVVAIARHYIGVPYVWGGTTPRGFDCSGLVRYVFRRIGRRLPRTTFGQMRAGHRVQHLALGDAVFFDGGDHVGIYAGRGRIIDAPHTGARVGYTPVYIFGGITAIRSYA